MSDWTTAANGSWNDAARWSDGVPNAAGAVASFTAAFANPNVSAQITFEQGTTTIGTLNLVVGPNNGVDFLGNTGVTDATLRFLGAGGGPAFLTVDTNGSTNTSEIRSQNGLNVNLGSDLIVTMTGSDTLFDIQAPISSTRDVYKFGDGTLRISGSNASMTGDYYLNAGRTEITSGNAMISVGVIKINNNATLAATASFLLAERIETGTGSASSNIVAETGTTLTLSGQLEMRSTSGSAVAFGSAADAGTIVLTGTSLINATGGFRVEGGTLRLGTAGVAANYFSTLSTTSSGLSVLSGATLDTGGFAATIDNLVVAAGTLQSTGGALDVTTDHNFGFASLAGTIVGTAQADRLVFNVASTLLLTSLAFNSWTNGTDTITINGNGLANTLTGSSQNDIINGGGGIDTLSGNGGADILDGGSGADAMAGGAGDDQYFVDNGGDTVSEAAGQGNDRVFASVSFALAAAQAVETLTTTDNAGTAAINLAGNELAQFILGNAGANILTSGGGADTLVGLGGNDSLIGNASAASTLQGGTGDDFYFVFNSGDSIVEFAGEGNDRLFSSVSYSLGVGRSIETLSTNSTAGTGAINLTGNALGQFILGNAGANILTGGGGGDTLAGLEGDDTLIGNADAASTLQGGIGNDFYFVFLTGDSLVEFAGEGTDRLFAGIDYVLSASQEIETLSTTNSAATTAINLTGNDLVQLILGNAGANTLSGLGGADTLAGLGGADILLGDDGDDELNGGAGNDVLNGGAGADRFIFADALGAGNVDVIQSFASGQDRLFLDRTVFTTLAPGALPASAFVLGTAAADADDRIIYNPATGVLSFDADGSGAGAAIQFAILAGQPALAAGDLIAI